MKTIAYASPYVPPEWIAAHGLEPLRLQPDGPPRDGPVLPTAGVCPYMRAFANQAASAPGIAGIVFTTVCDQMRRGCEQMHPSGAPVFCFNVPSTWRTDSALQLYMDELDRLGIFLVRHGGSHPEKTTLSHTLHECATPPPPDRPTLPGAVPVALTGGPRTKLDSTLCDLVEELGGTIVMDASEQGLLGRAPSFDSSLIDAAPLRALADAYLRRLPGVSRRPNTSLHTWLDERITDSGAHGVILLRHLWCDLWHGEVARIRDALSVPLLDIDLDGEDPVPRNRTRIEAFIEGLRSCRR